MEQLIEKLYYGHVCHEECTHDALVKLGDSIEDILNSFAQQLHNGDLGSRQIHTRLYFETARKLSDAITEGLGKASFSYDDPMNSLRATMLANVYAFSGAKSLTMNAAYTQLMFDADGKLKPFTQFRNDVQRLDALYNKDFLSTEYSNAVASGQMAGLWNLYNDNDWLKYSTAGDDRVRDEHRMLDGIVQQKKSSFWRKNWPPNGHRCRCTAVPADKPLSPMTEKEAGALAKNAVDPVFQNNVGITGIVFKNNHPYYKSLSGTGPLEAVRNYGLRKVSAILKDDLPAALHVDTETDYYAWWSDMIKTSGINKTDFELTDNLGVKVIFEQHFKTHILDNADSIKRHTYAANLETMLTNPDELWHTGTEWRYLKYYNDGLYCLAVIEDNGMMKAKTMFKVKKERYILIRSGILIKR